eukprot:EG_transcript_25110
MLCWHWVQECKAQLPTNRENAQRTPPYGMHRCTLLWIPSSAPLLPSCRWNHSQPAKEWPQECAHAHSCASCNLGEEPFHIVSEGYFGGCGLLQKGLTRTIGEMLCLHVLRRGAVHCVECK